MLFCLNDCNLSQWKLFLPLEWLIDFKNSVRSICFNISTSSVSFKSLKNFGSYLWLFAVSLTWHDNEWHMHVSVFFRWNRILIWIVFVVLGAIRDWVKTNCTKNDKGLCQPLSANSALHAKVCMHGRMKLSSFLVRWKSSLIIVFSISKLGNVAIWVKMTKKMGKVNN